MSDCPERDKWGTPHWLYDRLDREFHFDLDAAAEEHNAKNAHYLTDALNGEPWPGVGAVWINPPYSTVRDWFPRILEEAQHRPVVVLLPSRTETDWWHDYVLKADEIRFIRGRIAFVPPPGFQMSSAGNRPVFASVVAVFRRTPPAPRRKVSNIFAPRNSKLLAAGQRELPTTEDVLGVIQQ